MSELQVAEYLWVMVNLGECHVSKVIQFFSYTGYLLCLIIRLKKISKYKKNNKKSKSKLKQVKI